MENRMTVDENNVKVVGDWGLGNLVLLTILTSIL